MAVKLAARSAPLTVFEPALEHWPAAGVYQLWLWVSVDLSLTVGRLGRLTLPAGLYVYTGRAARGLVARVLRHVRGRRRRHWHIDYLLARRQVRLERVVLAADAPERECAVNQMTAGRGRCIAPGFGASDCRHCCGSHLHHLGTPGRASDQDNPRCGVHVITGGA